MYFWHVKWLKMTNVWFLSLISHAYCQGMNKHILTMFVVGFGSEVSGMSHMHQQKPDTQTDTIAVCQAQHSSNMGEDVAGWSRMLARSTHWLLYMGFPEVRISPHMMQLQQLFNA